MAVQDRRHTKTMVLNIYKAQEKRYKEQEKYNGKSKQKAHHTNNE
jgi:hypothetical protein